MSFHITSRYRKDGLVRRKHDSIGIVLAMTSQVVILDFPYRFYYAELFFASENLSTAGNVVHGFSNAVAQVGRIIDGGRYEFISIKILHDNCKVS